MSMDINEAFVRQYEAEVHEAYQRKGSKLRNTIRRKSGITGESTTFQKIGKGVAGKKTRHGKVPVMNVDHTPVTCTLEDWYAGEWIDKLDTFKIQHDERQALVNAGVYALGRKTDQLIIDKWDAETLAGQVTSTNLSAITSPIATSLLTALGGRDIPVDDGNNFAVVSWEVWGKLMSLDQFASADYVAPNELPFAGRGVFAKKWMGFMWSPHSGLTITANVRNCYVYHMSSTGHASGAEIQTDITWHGDYAAHFINNMMSQGACVIDSIGIQRWAVDESA
jgi:hypothetical protein